MRKFEDADGQSWVLSITTNAIRNCRGELDLNLMELFTSPEEFTAKIADDIGLFVDILYVVCQTQAIERNISDRQFGELFKFSHLQVAQTEFLKAMYDFQDDQEVSKAVELVVNATTASQETKRKEAVKKLTEAASTIQSIGIEGYLNSQESSE